MTPEARDELRRLAEDVQGRGGLISTSYVLALLDDYQKLERIGRALLYHDERGQGVGWSEAMDALHKLIGGDASLDA